MDREPDCEWDSKVMSEDFDQDNVFKVALIIGCIVFVSGIVGLILMVQ